MKSISVNFAMNQIGAFVFMFLCLPNLAAGGGFIIGVPLGYTPGTAPFVAINPVTGAYSTLNVSGTSYNALAQDGNRALYASSFSSTEENTTGYGTLSSRPTNDRRSAKNH
jgi:hypothetical protein